MVYRPPVFEGAFSSPRDMEGGKQPFVFDILAPDRVTSLLPDGLRLVLEVNPTQVSWSYAKQIERIATKGGWVEQHWGEAPSSMTLGMVTGGFKRLYSGMSNITGGGLDVGGTRRETIAHDKYLDLLALFHNNGSIYDTRGQIVFQGIIQVTFDGGIYQGWFSSFNRTDSAEKPYQFDLSADFTIAHEIMSFRSASSIQGGVGDSFDISNSLGAIRSSVEGVRTTSQPAETTIQSGDFASDPNVRGLA